MAILIDLNQTLIAGIMIQIAGKNKQPAEENLIRHLSLNILRTHVKKFKRDYGKVILCCDNRKYWRTEYFPYYKYSRKAGRKDSGLDWDMIHRSMNTTKADLRDYFPYKMIDVPGAEADDIIGILAPRLALTEKVMIVSSDRDFLQLQKYPNIEQYNPTTKTFLKSKNPEAELKEKIITGDRGDGIPNMLSTSDCFVTHTNQTPLTKKKMATLLNTEMTSENLTTEQYVRYMRNKVLIDFSHIPENIKNVINKTYDETKAAPRQLLFSYFVENGLKNLLEVIEDF